MKKISHQDISKSISNYVAWEDFRLVCRKTLHSNTINTPGEHEHRDFYELVTVTAGRGVHRVGRQDQAISPGNVFLIQPHQSHCYIEYENLEIYNLLFTRKFVRYFLPDLTRLSGFQMLFNLSPAETAHARTDGIRIREEHFPEVIRVLNEMDFLNSSMRPGDKTLLLSDFIRVMLLIARHSHWAGPSRQSYHIDQLTRLLGELEKSFAAEWSLARMAEKCRMSVSSFRQTFRKLTGTPPIEYLLRLRLAKSAVRLETSADPLETVAQDCGFHDANYFARQFKAHYHILPARYRRECQAGVRPPLLPPLQ